MEKNKISLILQALVLFLPVNIYMWGNWLLVSIQWPLFRYQQSFFGNSLIFCDRDLSYIISGQNTGFLNISATILWTMGTAFLLAGFLAALLIYFKTDIINNKTTAILTIISGFLFLSSALCRFKSGFAIPFGIPLILFIGWRNYHENNEISTKEIPDLDFIRDRDFVLKLGAILLYLVALMYAVAAQSDRTSLIIASITFFVILLILFPVKVETHKKYLIYLLLIILAGTFLRLWLAYSYFGNFDMESYTTVSEIVLKGLNVYNETPFYNYSPVWLNILGPLRAFSDASSLPFHFAVRGFLTIIDIFTLLLLLVIGKSEGMLKEGLIRLSLLFYLNPVTYLITGFHGQFENVALFFVVLGIYFFQKSKVGNNSAKYYSWICLSVGLIVKHNTLILVLSGIVNLFKKAKYIMFFFTITIILFLLTFVIYWSTGSQGIISHVFMYGGLSGIYGITSFIKFPYLKYLFIAGMLIYPFMIKDREIVEQFLLGSLFFLTFTTGIGIQYFVLPIIFGALRPSNWFILYTFVTTVVILGAVENINLFGFSFFTFNVVWLCTIFWFIFTHFKLYEKSNSHQ